MVIPEFQANKAMDVQVDVDQVRPWGLAAEEDLQAPPERDNWGRPAWVEELTGPANNWNTRALAPMPKADEEEDFLPPAPPPLPEGITPLESSSNQASSSSSGSQVPGSQYSAKHSCSQVLAELRLSTPPPGLATAPEADTEEPELAPAPLTQYATDSKEEYLAEARSLETATRQKDCDELALPVGVPEGSTPAASLPEPASAAMETMDSWATAIHRETHMGQARPMYPTWQTHVLGASGRWESPSDSAPAAGSNPTM
jgi:hypothetical protein